MNTLKDRDLHSRWGQLTDAQGQAAASFQPSMTRAARDVAMRVGIDGFAQMVSSAVLGDSFIVRAIIGDHLRKAIEGAIRKPLLKAFNLGLDHQMAGDAISAAGITPELYVPDEDAQEYAARVAMNYSRTSQEGMEELINRGVERGMDRDRLAVVAQRALGVDRRRAQAVDRFESALDGPSSQRQARAGAYAAKQVSDRSKLFAETETMTAANLAQQQLWNAAIRQGHLPPDTKKVWITALDERVCPICKPMDNKRALLTTMFTTSAGVVLVPPVHPRCRCVIVPDVLMGSRSSVIARLAA